MIEQIPALFDGGDFLAKVMQGHRDLRIELLGDKAEHDTRGYDGTMTIQIGDAPGKSGDVAMGAEVKFRT